MPAWRRTRVVVSRGAQLRLAADMLLHVAVFAALIGVIVYVDPLTTLFSSIPASEHRAAVEKLIELNASSWPLFLIAFIVMVFFSFIWSNRVVGPVFRLKRTLESFSEGDFSGDVSFRKGDYHSELLPACRSLAGRVRGDVLKLRDAVDRLEGVFENIAPPAEAVEALSAVKDVAWSYKLKEDASKEGGDEK